MRKSDLTGAVSTVDSEALQLSLSSNIDQKLQGLAAGVLVTSDSNQPGGGVSIRIRGASSINAGNEPLYVIDGVGIDNSTGSTGGTVGNYISPLSSLNPDDIESIEVLKDASSTAIYGARGSNGVVLITTKQGKEGKNTVNFRTTWGVSEITKRMNTLNGPEYVSARKEAIRNSFGYTFHESLTTESGILNNVFTWNGTEEMYEKNVENSLSSAGISEPPRNTNWQDEVFVNGMSQNSSLDFSGGSNGSNYFISLGRNDVKGIVRNSDFARTSLRVNMNRKIGKLTIGERISISDIKANFIRTEGERQNAGVGSIIAAALRYRPTSPISVKDETGDEIFTQEILMTNPILMTTLVTNETNNLRVNGNVFGQYQLNSDLYFKTTVGFDFSNNRDQFYAPSKNHYLGSLSGGYAKIGSSQGRQFTNTNMLNYSKSIDVHRVNATAVNEVIWARSDRMLNIVSGFPNDNLREYDLSSGTNVSPPNNYTQDFSLASFLGRVNYNYDDRYLVTGSARYDGSSRFGVNNKWAFFPSVSVAWRITKEDFMDNVNILNNLKLRVSYGVVGNQNIALYSSTSPLASTTYILNHSTVTGYYPSRVANPSLRWERKKQFNVGLDFGILQNRINGSVEYYQDRTDDLLINKPIPAASGYSRIAANLGEIENRGLEFSFNGVVIQKNKFSWNTNFNVSFPKNKVLNLGGLEAFPAGIQSDGARLSQTQRLIVGEALGQFWGFRKTGIAKTPDDLSNTYTGLLGNYTYEDISGPDGIPDGKIDNAYDKVIIGDANPDIFGGFTNEFRYGNWGLVLFFQGTYGNDIMNVTRAVMTTGGISANQYTDVLDAWQPRVVDGTTGAVVKEGNPDGKMTILSNTAVPDETNDGYLEDGSYLRLKNLSFSYSLPKSICRKIGASVIQLSVTGTNLWTLTNYSGYDPETDSQRNGSLAFGHDYFGYPQNVSYSFGVNLTF